MKKIDYNYSRLLLQVTSLSDEFQQKGTCVFQMIDILLIFLNGVLYYVFFTLFRHTLGGLNFLFLLLQGLLVLSKALLIPSS